MAAACQGADPDELFDGVLAHGVLELQPLGGGGLVDVFESAGFVAGDGETRAKARAVVQVSERALRDSELLAQRRGWDPVSGCQ